MSSTDVAVTLGFFLFHRNIILFKIRDMLIGLLLSPALGTKNTHHKLEGMLRIRG